MMKCPSCGNEFIADADTALCPECEENLKWDNWPPLDEEELKWDSLPTWDKNWEIIPDKGDRE